MSFLPKVESVSFRYNSAVLDSDNYSHVSRVMQRVGSTSVEINDELFVPPSIDFLPHFFPTLQELRFVTSRQYDLAPLLSLPSLSNLSFSYGPTQEFDFTSLRLKGISFNHKSGKTDSVYGCKALECMAIFGYPYADLVALEGLRRLSTLRLSRASKLGTLDGIQRLSNIRRIWIQSATRLSSLAALSRLKLRYLHFEGCRSISDYSILGTLPLDGLTIRECGPVRDLDFLRSLSKLRALIIAATKIESADLEPIADLEKQGNLERLVVSYRKEYNYQKGDFSTPSSLGLVPVPDFSCSLARMI